MVIRELIGMEDNLTIIERRLKLTRERFGYSQLEVAKKMNVNRSLIALWENGYANISLKQLIKLAFIYQVPIDYLLGIIDETNDYHYNFIYKMDLKYIGTKLKEIRKNNFLTQEKFAKKLDTKRSSISYYEIGKMMISTADLKQICETFGVSADYIVGNIKVNISRKIKNKIKIKDIKEKINI